MLAGVLAGSWSHPVNLSYYFAADETAPELGNIHGSPNPLLQHGQIAFWGGDSPLLALGVILREGACRGSGVSVLVSVLPRSSCGPHGQHVSFLGLAEVWGQCAPT